MRIQYLFALIFLASCTKEVVEPIPALPAVKTTVTVVKNGNVTTITGPYKGIGVDASSNGFLYYNNNIIISPSDDRYISPIHLVKIGDSWRLEAANYGTLMDRPRNTTKVSEGVYAWANGSNEQGKSGNLYVSTTNADNTLTWKQYSPKGKDNFYHYVAAGDIDNNGKPEVISYVGAESESPEWLGILNEDTAIYDILPTIFELEAAVGFVRRDLNPSQKLNSFSFGAIAVANVDLTTPEPELILTTTKALMSEYYSFILLNYDKTAKKFKITEVIKSNGLMKDYNMGVADIKFGDFNDDNITDVVVTMGNHLTKDYTGVQVWLNDGKGNLTPSKNKSELFSSEFSNLIYFTNLEVGKFRNHDCVFLHFDRTRYDHLNDPTKFEMTDGMLDLRNFFFVNNGGDSKFTHLSNLTAPGQIPTVVKGYFENNVLRLIGLRDVDKDSFEILDITAQ